MLMSHQTSIRRVTQELDIMVVTNLLTRRNGYVNRGRWTLSGWTQRSGVSTYSVRMGLFAL